MADEKTISAQLLAGILGVSLRAVHKRADHETWQHVHEKTSGRGRPTKKFLIHSLPAEIQAKYHSYKNRCVQKSNSTPCDCTLNSKRGDLLLSSPSIREGEEFFKQNSQPVSLQLAPWQNRRAAARFDLCCQYIKVIEAARKAKSRRAGNKTKGPKRNIGQAAKDFCDAYNTGIPSPDIYAIIGAVAPKTLAKWAKLLQDSSFNMDVLAERYGQHKKGKRTVSDTEMQVMLKYALHPNQLRISQVIRWAKHEMTMAGSPSKASEATMRRALLDWKAQHYDTWTFARKGEKALADKVLPYIERDASLLEVGECLVADGHVLNFQVVNPFTGRPGRAMLVMFFDWASRYPAGWNIMFTENTQNIHAALRRAILNLGKIPGNVLLDNGKAFKAKIFTSSPDFTQSGIRGLYAKLGIETHFAAPYNARAKTVERFFGTFNEIERLLPSYTGQSIDDKPARMHRNERLHKRLHNSFVPTIDQAHAIIKAWAWDEYATRPHEGISNARPADLWVAGKGSGVDESLLRILMMATTVKAVRQNGITMFGVHYYDEALYGYRRPVQVRYDIEDMEQVHVYTEDGTEYLCTARPIRSVHPLAKTTGKPIDMEALRQGITLQKKLKKQTESVFRQQAESITAIPSIVDANITSAAGIEEHISSRAAHITKAEAERIEADAASVKVIQLHKDDSPRIFMSKGEAYEHHLRARISGEQLSADQIQLMEEYESSSEYALLKEYYDHIIESGGEDHGRHMEGGN